MSTLPESLLRLIEELSRFPGIGKKTAQRLAFHILNSNNETVAHLAEAMTEVKTRINNCSICGAITEEDPCGICTDPKRRDDLICIVEDAEDIYAFERTNVFSWEIPCAGRCVITVGWCWSGRFEY